MKTKLGFMIKKVGIAAAFILCVFLLVSCSQGPYETEIASARIKGDEIEINVTLDKTYIEEHRGDQVYLFALPSAYTDDISLFSIDPVFPQKLIVAIAIAGLQKYQSLTLFFACFDHVLA